MKYRLLFLLTLLMTHPVCAQTGYTAAKAAKPTNSEWRNWTFAAIALVTVTAGIIAVTVDNGRPANS